jgi:hypothetical protein
MLPYLPDLIRFGPRPALAFGRQFKHPFLRSAVPLMFAWPDAPACVKP